MNRRDPGSRQAGGYRSDDNSWDSPQQATQWQDDSSNQTGSGGNWGNADGGSTEQGRTEERETRSLGTAGGHSDRYQSAYPSDRYSSDRYQSERGSRSRYGFDRRDDEAGGWDRGWDRSWDRDRETSHGRDDDWRDAGRLGGGRRYGAHGESEYRGEYRPDYRGSRGYRSSGGRDADYPIRSFDASGGNDYSSFTSEDFGGRDFSRRGGGLSGGASSESYRPSYGPGSWGRKSSDRSSGRDYGDWREYGESRGFLERAGDEIASWFGDEDAARRREQDHRGRGPSDYTRSDERIREDVNDALTHDWRLDASSIRVTVKDGEVTLEGAVSGRTDKRRAEDVADDVTGVRHVQNNLRVRSGTDSVTAGTSTPGLSHSASTGSGSTAGSTGSTTASSTTAGTTGGTTSTGRSSTGTT